MAAVAYGSLPFQQQIAFFRAKRNVLTESYLDVWESQHDNAFMVAGANRDDLLADLRTAIQRVIEKGGTLEEFRRDFDRIVATYGWDYNGGRNWRSRVIYETNLRQSYNAGRWAQLQALKKARPYWRYRHSDAVEHPRPQHEAWDGMILHADDPWWEYFFPTNGWGCQCYVEALSERDLKRLGKSGPDKAPPIKFHEVLVGQRSPGGPRLVETPVGVDPGFGYAPGRSLDDWPSRRGGPQTPPSMQGIVANGTQSALDKTTRLPAAAAARSAEATLDLQRAADALQAGYAQWRNAVAAADKSHSASFLIGALERGLVRKLAAEGVRPATAAIEVAATQLGGTLPAAAMTQLPTLLRHPTAVLLDKASNTLVYVLDAVARRRNDRIAVQVAMTAEGGSGANAFSTAVVMTLRQLRDALAGGRLQLLQGTVA